MKISSKNIFIFLIILLVIWFIYLERAILSPFILAAIFAYIFNPVVSFFQKKLRFPRSISVITIYFILIFLIFTLFSYVGGQLVAESKQLSNIENRLTLLEEGQFSYLPEWRVGERSFGFQTLSKELVKGLGQAAQNIQNNIWPYFTLAASQAINLVVFLITAFYFLREGEKIFQHFRSWISEKHHDEFDEILLRINRVLGNYLRGELILVAIMSVLSWLTLTILGVRFALILGIITGFLELIPYFGPFIAIALVSLTAFITGSNYFGFDPATLALIVAITFFVFRQFEDYFIIPEVLGRATNLHPLVVLFSVIAGGHLAGALGFVIAVPIVSTLRVLFPYILKKVS